jgi:hypothetical protein
MDDMDNSNVFVVSLFFPLFPLSFLVSSAGLFSLRGGIRLEIWILIRLIPCAMLCYALHYSLAFRRLGGKEGGGVLLEVNLGLAIGIDAGTSNQTNICQHGTLEQLAMNRLWRREYIYIYI